MESWSGVHDWHISGSQKSMDIGLPPTRGCARWACGRVPGAAGQSSAEIVGDGEDGGAVGPSTGGIATGERRPEGRAPP
jgi:hypothetical protein